MLTVERICCRLSMNSLLRSKSPKLWIMKTLPPVATMITSPQKFFPAVMPLYWSLRAGRPLTSILLSRVNLSGLKDCNELSNLSCNSCENTTSSDNFPITSILNTSTADFCPGGSRYMSVAPFSSAVLLLSVSGQLTLIP